MADFAEHTPKPSGTSPKESKASKHTNSMFGNELFIQPSVNHNESKEPKDIPKTDEVEEKSTQSVGPKLGLFGEPAFFQPRPTLVQPKLNEDASENNGNNSEEEQVPEDAGTKETTSSLPENDGNTTNNVESPDPIDSGMRAAVQYHTALTAEQKAYFNWDQVVAEFKASEGNSGLSDYYLHRWARKQLREGWSLGDPVPDLTAFRAHYGDPYVYQVTKEKVPTLYVYWYEGNKNDIRTELLNNRNYDGFWVYVDSITGKKSELQQRDSFAKYYATHPISNSDIQLVFQFLESKGKKFSGNTATVTRESGTFRNAVESAQDLIFGSKVKNYGLLTPETKKAITTQLKNAQKGAENKFAEYSADKVFKDVGNKTGLAKDSPGISSKSGEWHDGGVNLRSMPFTMDDTIVTSNPVLQSEVAKSIIAHLPFGTRMTILRETVKNAEGEDDGWYWVMTETGQEGYVAKHLVETRLPSPDVRYHLVEKNQSLLEIARKYYSPKSEDRVGVVESNGEFRNYVLELARYNEEWRGDEAGAVFKAGFDSNDPNSWKHTVVRIGLRMWIPSAAEMYYRIHNKPASQKFDNTNWAEDGGQWIIDNSPVTIMINAYLDWWATIPQAEREKNVQKYYQQQLRLYEKMQTDWSWLDSYILPLVPLVPGAGAAIGISFIYDLYVSFNIGYFDYLSKSDPKLLVLNAERTLRNLTQLEHYKGLLFGFFEGVYNWGKDLVDTFVMVGEAIGTLTEVLTDPETYAKIAQFTGDAMEYVITNKDEIQKSLQDVNFMDTVIGAISAMRSGLTDKGKQMGSDAAQALVKFAGGSPYEQGFSVGKIIGFIVPEVVLAVVTSGIGTAIKGALKGVQIITKILNPLLKGLKVGLSLLQTAAGAAGDLVKFISAFIKNILAKTKKGASKFWEKMQELFEGFHKFLKNKYDDVATTNKAGTPDVDDYLDTNKKRFKDEFDNDPDLKKGDPDYQDKLAAAIKAKAIVEMNDALDPSPPALEVVTFLNATINLPGNDKFKFERNGLGDDHYRIYFNPTIDPDFTEGSGMSPEEIEKQKKSELSARKKRLSETELREELTVRGFKNAGELVERLGNLRNKIKSIDIPGIGKLDDVEVGLRGSSVTGTSTKGGFFRQGVDGVEKASDLDFFFSSEKLNALLKKKGFNLTEPISPDRLDDLSPNLSEVLDSFATESRKQLGRKSEAYFLSDEIISKLIDGQFILN